MKKTSWILLLVAILANACAPNNVKIEPAWEKYFTQYKVEGTFMLYDNGKGTFRVYNIDRAKERFTPASTFKIFNSLVALETGVVKDTTTILPWDGIMREERWNEDLSLNQAFKVSCVPCYQQIARKITQPIMQKWLDTVKYGNMKISKIDTFWLDNSLQISPDEELGFVKKLYFDQLPFHKLTMQWVRAIMLMEKTSKYDLCYKTGWGITGKKQIGWVTGWIEKDGLPTFFVLNIETEKPDFDMVTARKAILTNILTEAGYIE